MEFGMQDDKVSWEDTEQLDSWNEHTCGQWTLGINYVTGRSLNWH